MRQCRCFSNGFTLGWDREKITQFVRDRKMCSDPQFLCPTIDKELRRTQADADRRAQYAKRLRKAGYSQEEIAEMPTRTRRRRNRVYEIDDS